MWADPERTASTLKADIQYIVGKFGARPGLLRDATRGERPWVYIHDSYRVDARALAAILTPQGSSSIRGTAIDVVAFGLLYRHSERAQLLTAGFDGERMSLHEHVPLVDLPFALPPPSLLAAVASGVATHFAANGFSDGARTSLWPTIADWAAEHDLLFVPAVAPGYDDLKVRPVSVRRGSNTPSGQWIM